MRKQLAQSAGVIFSSVKEGLNKFLLGLSARRQSDTYPDWLTPNQMLTHLTPYNVEVRLPAQFLWRWAGSYFLGFLSVNAFEH